jgi:hypothetical protein
MQGFTELSVGIWIAIRCHWFLFRRKLLHWIHNPRARKSLRPDVHLPHHAVLVDHVRFRKPIHPIQRVRRLRCILHRKQVHVVLQQTPSVRSAIIVSRYRQPTTRGRACCMVSRLGSSSRHGGHQLAQKFSTITFPPNLPKSTVRCEPVTTTSGAASPSCRGWVPRSHSESEPQLANIASNEHMNVCVKQPSLLASLRAALAINLCPFRQLIASDEPTCITVAQHECRKRIRMILLPVWIRLRTLIQKVF